MKIVIVLSDANVNNYDLSDTFNIGVERGCINLINNKIKIDVSIGDFDSVTKEELDIIKNNSIKHVQLNSEKDFTDTYEAVKYAKNIDEDIVILGGIKGNRVEHLYANINLLAKYDNVKIIGENSYIYSTKESIKILKDEYKYISLYALEEISSLTLEGFKYNLNNYNMKPYDNMGTSNELINDGKITFDSGKLLVIKSIS